MTFDPAGLPLPLSGTTTLYAILGDPIAQAGSPGLFNSAFRERGINAILTPMHVPPPALANVIKAFRSIKNFDGLIITVPHKIAVARLVDELGPGACKTGAVNTIRKHSDGRLVGENFDGEGFLCGLAKRGHSVRGRRVLVIGAGGAGCAVAHAIADQAPSALGLFDIDQQRSQALICSIKKFSALDVFEAPPNANGFEVIVNCTSVGMNPSDPLPVDISDIDPNALVADIILKPAQTPLLTAALARGCATHQGPNMLEGQVDAVLQFFLG